MTFSLQIEQINEIDNILNSTDQMIDHFERNPHLLENDSNLLHKLMILRREHVKFLDIIENLYENNQIMVLQVQKKFFLCLKNYF